MLHRIKLAIAQLGEESTMTNYDVTIKEIAPRYVASVRDILESYNYEGRLWHYMMKETADQNLTPANPCLAFGIFHDAEYKERDVDVEIQWKGTIMTQSTSASKLSQQSAWLPRYTMAATKPSATPARLWQPGLRKTATKCAA